MNIWLLYKDYIVKCVLLWTRNFFYLSVVLTTLLLCDEPCGTSDIIGLSVGGPLNLDLYFLVCMK